MSQIPRLPKPHRNTLVLINLLVFFSCSKIVVSDDPILGVWCIEFEVQKSIDTITLDKREWIFNDAFLGRYHYYENEQILIANDFIWSFDNDRYTVKYLGTDLPDDIFTIRINEDAEQMIDITGQVIGKR